MALSSEAIGIIVEESRRQIKQASLSIQHLRRAGIFTDEQLRERATNLHVMEFVDPATIAATRIELDGVSDDESLRIYARATEKLASQWSGEARRKQRTETHASNFAFRPGGLAEQYQQKAENLRRRAAIIRSVFTHDNTQADSTT